MDRPLAGLAGPVWPPLPRTSGSAELVAAGVGLELAEKIPAPHIVTDYATTVRWFDCDQSFLLSHKRAPAGILRTWCTSPAFPRTSCSKIKSHVDASVATMANHANDCADRIAKDYAKSLADPNSREHNIRSILAQRVVLFAAQALALFPSLRDHLRDCGVKPSRPAPQAVRPSRQAPSVPHSWVARPSTEHKPNTIAWRCLRCGTSATSLATSRPAPGSCCGSRPVLDPGFLIGLASRNHKVWVSALSSDQDQSEFVLACTQCGAYTTPHRRIPDSLLGSCVGSPPNPGYQYRRTRFLHGLHPDTRVLRPHLLAPVPIQDLLVGPDLPDIGLHGEVPS